MKTIFVSSTFKDMHFERDAIQEITLPALKSEAIKYGENVSFCDLRWGINTGDLDSEEGSRKVLDVCLDEIDRCKPPMVVILGDRYGWIPSKDLTQSAAERKKIELEDLQISVTALEIAYGALSTPERCRQALFYFRHIESDCPRDYSVEDAEHEEKLNQLKAKIDELTGGRIKHYSVSWNGEKLDGVISFAEMLAEDIKEVLLPEWKKKELLTPFERERLTHWSFIAEKNEMFSARSVLVQKYYDDLTQNGKHFLAVKAPSGSGKSMLFSNLALKLRDSGYDVVPFMSGLTSESNDSVDILRNAIYYIEDLLGFSHESVDFSFNGIGDSSDTNGEEPKEKKNGIEKLRERLFELCVECEQANKRVIIMVDAVDQLASDDNRNNLIFIPERLSSNVKFVMTCLPELDLAGRNTVTLKPMDDTEKREVIEGILKSHNRELEEKVIRKMIKAKSSNNPLFLSLLVQRLLMMNRDDFLAIKKEGDDMKAISKHQLEVIATCPDSLQKMSAALLTEAGKRINEELVRKVAEYLAVSRHGLRQEDLSVLLGDNWSALDFAHFITYMDENFIQRDDGRFDFSHKCIREGFLELCPNTLAIHGRVLEYFESLPAHDCVRMQEIIHHYIVTNNKTQFISYIKEIKDNNEANEKAANDLFAHCLLDDGKWLCSIFEKGMLYGVTIDVCQFFTHYFDRSNSGSMIEMRMRVAVLSASIKTAEACSLDTVEKQAMLVNLYMTYAEKSKDICSKSHWAFRDESDIYYLKAFNVANRMESSINDYDHLIKMIDICHGLCEHASSGWAEWQTKITYYANVSLELCRRAQQLNNTVEIRLKTIQSLLCLSDGHKVLSIGGIDAYKPFADAIQLLDQIDAEHNLTKENEIELRNIYLNLVKMHPLKKEKTKYYHKALELSRNHILANNTYTNKIEWLYFNCVMGKMLHEECRDDETAMAQMGSTLQMAKELYCENPSLNILATILQIYFQKSLLENLDKSIAANIEALSFLFEKLSDTDEMLYVFPEILVVLDFMEVDNRNKLKFKLWVKYLLRYCKLIYRVKIKNESIHMPQFNHKMIMGHLINQMQCLESISNPNPIVSMLKNRCVQSKKHYQKDYTRNSLQSNKNMLFLLHSDYSAIGKIYFKSSRMGDLKKAIKYYVKAKKISEKLLQIKWGEDTGGRLTSYSRRMSDLFWLGLAYQKLGKYGKAIHYYNQCIELSQNVPKYVEIQIKEYVINSYIGLGECKAQKKQDCEHFLQKALEMRISETRVQNTTKRDDSPALGGYSLHSWKGERETREYQNKFLTYVNWHIDGRYCGGRLQFWGNEAIATFLQTLDAYKNLLNGYRQITRYYAESLDIKYKKIALEYSTKALSTSLYIVEKWNTKENQKSLVYDYINVANTYLDVGDFDKALKYADQAQKGIVLLKGHNTQTNIDEVEALLYQLYGDLLLTRDSEDDSNVKKAIGYYKKMIELDEKSHEDTYYKMQTMAFSMKRLAEAYELLDTGNDSCELTDFHKKAVQQFEKMIYIKDEVIPDLEVLKYLNWYCVTISDKECLPNSEKIFFIEKAIQYLDLEMSWYAINSFQQSAVRYGLKEKLQKYKEER